MNGSFPDSLLEEIRLRTDIVRLVGDYVPLTRRGTNYFGLCPFHTDSKPSFSVNGDKQIFKCFGCGAGGDVFRFLMLREGLDFPETVRELARRAGVTVPQHGGRSKEDLQAESCRGVCEAAATFFYEALREGQAGASARRYLEGRGLDSRIAEKFRIGFAPPGWQVLWTHLKKCGFGADDVIAAGLARRGTSGEPYDYFRDRVMFPVWDPQGRVAGFGGRVLNDGEPKYLNSPETACFNKGRLLFGLHLARQAAREEGCLVLMEGYLDVVSAHRHGITNAVASLGTSLTKEQARLISRYTGQVVVAYDADAAGQAAAERSLNILKETNLRARVLALDEGKDPDEYLRSKGPEGWRELVGKASSPVAFMLKRVVAGKGGDKGAVVREMLPVLAGIDGVVEKEEAVGLVARSVGLGWELIREELRGFEQDRKKWPNPDKIAKNRHNILKNPGNRREEAGRQAQKAVLRILLVRPDLTAAVRGELGDDFIEDPVLAEVFALLAQYTTYEGYSPAALFPGLTGDAQECVSGLLMEENPAAGEPALLNDYVAAVRRIAGRRKRDILLKEMAQAEASGDLVVLTQLMEQYKGLIDDC
ncbi:MAG: DNA primase [Peptococcaceae bacterium]|jgi:DNA primase|nr:DNA primase [Peptococcaceae bacterium]